MEANVIYRISKGDEQAFDRFMDYWSDALYRYAYGILGVREPAEEVVSDVFVEIWRGRAGLLEIESMAAYLRTLTYRKAVSACVMRMCSRMACRWMCLRTIRYRRWRLLTTQ